MSIGRSGEKAHKAIFTIIKAFYLTTFKYLGIYTSSIASADNNAAAIFLLATAIRARRSIPALDLMKINQYTLKECESSHGSLSHLFKLFTILQRITYYLFIGLSLIFLLGILIGGYKYLDSFQKEEAPAEIGSKTIKSENKQ